MIVLGSYLKPRQCVLSFKRRMLSVNYEKYTLSFMPGDTYDFTIRFRLKVKKGHVSYRIIVHTPSFLYQENSIG